MKEKARPYGDGDVSVRLAKLAIEGDWRSAVDLITDAAESGSADALAYGDVDRGSWSTVSRRSVDTVLCIKTERRESRVSHL